MEYELIIAIDPGKSGAVTTFFKGEVRSFPMPYTHKEQEDFFNYLNSLSENSICFLERVSLRSDDVSVPGKAFVIQKMLNHFQQVKTMLSTHRIKYVLLSPRTWQKKLNLISLKEESKKERKNRYKMAAKNKFPQLKVILKNCDALLILLCGFLMLKNEPGAVQIMLDSIPENNNF